MPRVMIVDDAAFMRQNLKKVLTDNGFEVVAEAHDGVQAVDLYEQHKPDIVTMDITMPNMDGLEALRRIRSNDPASRVVMCSAMGQQSMVVEAIHAGAKDFIVKPFQPDRVVDALKQGLK